MILEARAAVYQYQQGPRIGPVSVRVQSGQWLGVAGPNGAGKTTLLKLLAGALSPSVGLVTLDGEPLSQFSRVERARRVAVVPQRLDISFDLTVRTVVELGRLAHLKWSERLLPLGGEHRRIVDEALSLTDTERLQGRSFRTLSGGEQQRVLLAAALAQAAPVLILDEPTASLDPGHARHFLDLVQRRVQVGQVVVMAQHDLSLLSHYCTDVLLMRDGMIVASGDPGAVLSRRVLSDTFDTALDVIPHPATGRPLVIYRTDSHP